VDTRPHGDDFYTIGHRGCFGNALTETFIGGGITAFATAGWVDIAAIGTAAFGWTVKSITRTKKKDQTND